MAFSGPGPDRPAEIRIKHGNSNSIFLDAQAKSPGLSLDRALVCQRSHRHCPRSAAEQPEPRPNRDRVTGFTTFSPTWCPPVCPNTDSHASPVTACRSSHGPHPRPSPRSGTTRFSSLVPMLARSRHGGLLAGPRHTRHLPPEKPCPGAPSARTQPQS